MDRKQFEARLVAKAWKDEQFRKALKADPRGTLLAELEALHSSAALPANVKVTVLEETPEQVYLVIPNQPRTTEGALDDTTLEAIAAGGEGDMPEISVCLNVTTQVNGVVEVVAAVVGP